MSIALLVASLAVTVPAVSAPQPAKPHNLAADATVTASSEYSGAYLAKFAVDGIIPELMSKDDAGRAWAVNGAQARDRASFILEWDHPVTVGEVIYYGRTSWLIGECWKGYEVRLEDSEGPAAKGQFEMNAGPQRISLTPTSVRKVRLDFFGSRGGINPGAAEIEVYSESPPEDALPKLKRYPKNHALEARVTVSSEYSDQYLGRLAVDGQIPEPFSNGDVGKAWAVKGSEANNQATFALEWDKPVDVAEVVYYGRTAVLVEECWKDFELWLDADERPAAKGTFELGSGAQPIKLTPRKVRKVTLKFLSSYGGPNPGAAEIQVLDREPPEGFLSEFKRGGWDRPEESPELAQLVSERRLGFDKLLLIERKELNPSHVYTACCEGFQPGGGLYVLSPPTPDGELTRLVDSPEGQILDCDVSFDAKEILFSWRRTASDTYHLYRINADGSGLTQLTEGPHHNYNACWLPDGGIAFCSTRATVFALCFVTPSGVLYRMDRDGSNVTRLSANYVNDFTPSVLDDGRLLYSRWEYVDKPAIPIQSLWTLNPDGTELSAFYGNRVLSPASFLEARAIPGTEKVLCTLTAHNGPIRGGVGVVDRSRGDNAQDALVNLTPKVDIGRVDQGSGNQVNGPFESPYPLDAERFLVSGKGNVFVGDYSGRWALLKPRADGLGFYNPQPLRPRPAPPVIAHDPKPTEPGEAALLLLDVYNGLEPQVQRGTIKQIAVVEEVAKPLRTAVLGFGFQRPVISCGATYAVKKVWGYAKVEPDGSAHFRVPTGLPLYFEALDATGQAVQRMRSFTHFMPGEKRSCVGCHEHRNETPRSRKAAAASRNPQELEPPEWGAGNFDYSTIVQPVLDKHCAKCHSGVNAPRRLDLSGGKTDWFSVSYDCLTRGYVSWIDTRNGQEANILQIAPNAWGSPASKLTERLLSGHPDQQGMDRIHLDDASRRRLFAWIDLNVPYYGTYEMAYPDAEGGRRLYPQDLDAKLSDVSQRRCASCHQGGLPSSGFIRLTDPEPNDFLVAPLSRAAGGRQSCGKPIFETTADPDYQALLTLIGPTRTLLAERPRMDMPGAKAAVADRSCR
ncbi:MAG: hypothetical protein COZ06_09680 [Armatimonadetes bacterium CG_4_10_14_3_um_filter_66_18]|nr:hypothetical protein [Armatimonadota bacterium]OIP07314.1 MAG: hypothetical protein AUJ96_07635 [Armatimonadetes bacterium CG2_30_66_41]PIU95418.1 MAG: hypothetical protein COS65_02610 [Armatimonadetes bacterium CG06_land_8_20_14_3_00_66_21]PIX43559.1 MAG: hypothetical protein COZ57_18910 [Armatimonadetes bacterium CG_4_8_14_3_um_filter_66_20]PIY50393.1 MAG: hypothetical protein COZ06_09680 [Armatimonadetes bacterium CG_4_10_14_3_um_filter_66_18]PIZ36604.1 MAG: hypothetical protein COY42_25